MNYFYRLFEDEEVEQIIMMKPALSNELNFKI